MVYDAVVLAGGRSSRLAPLDKTTLLAGGRSLLQLTVAAASGARRTVIVGDADGGTGNPIVRECPAFGGPVAALAAGIDGLEAPAPLLLVLAADMPAAGGAIASLAAAAEVSAADGILGLDGGREQPLLAFYRTAALRAALDTAPVEGRSMRSLLAGMAIEHVPIPAGSARDVDTPEDVSALGLVAP